jgi:predicted transcriptional regulator
LPPSLAARFTLAETAVLAVVSAEVRRHGACTLTVGHIAALAGVSETTVRNAVREARALSLVQVEERRVSAWRNKPNRITITSREWLSWLRLQPKRGGCTFAKPTPTQENNRAAAAQRKRVRAAEGQGAKPAVPWRDTR